MAKCILAVSDLGYKETFGTEKLCSEVDVGIELGIHSMQLVWKHNLQEEYLGFLLVDVYNPFYEEN